MSICYIIVILMLLIIIVDIIEERNSNYCIEEDMRAENVTYKPAAIVRYNTCKRSKRYKMKGERTEKIKNGSSESLFYLPFVSSFKREEDKK